METATMQGSVVLGFNRAHAKSAGSKKHFAKLQALSHKRHTAMPVDSLTFEGGGAVFPVHMHAKPPGTSK